MSGQPATAPRGVGARVRHMIEVEGKAVEAVALELGVTERVVRRERSRFSPNSSRPVGLAERVREMTVERGMSSPQIARELGVNERTVHRYRRKLDIAQPRAKVPNGDELQWMKTVRSEGMPAPWIAETVGLSRDAVTRRLPMPPGASRAWLQVWASIRRNPALLELHREFSGGQRPIGMAA